MSQAIKGLLDSLKSFVAYLKSTNIWRPRFSVAFWVSLLGLVAITALIWYFDLFDDVTHKVTLNLLYSVLPVLLLLRSPEEEPANRTFAWMIYALVSMLVGGILLEFAAEREWQSLGINVTVILVSLPFFLICWVIIRKKPLLWVAAVPLVTLAVIYLNFGVFSHGDRLTYALVPVPAVLVVSALWLALSRILLCFTEQWRVRRTRGPLMESITMFFLFAPVNVLGIFLARLFTSNETWPTVVGVLLSVIFGSVVSVPIREFLLDLGKLPVVQREKVVT